MRNKIIIFIVLFIIAVTIMTTFNDKTDINTRYDKNLIKKVDIRNDVVLKINLINTDGKTSRKNKLEVVESSKLKDSVEIYRYKFYEQVDDNYEISVDNNDIYITDNFGNISIYRELPFLSINNKEEYMSNFPETVYKIYIPQGMEYSIE